MEERIDVEVAGQLVEGRVFFSVNNITVQITYPFEGITLPSHLPYFSLPFFRFERDGRLTPYGRQSAKELLTDLYDACCFCEANEEALLWECRKVLDRSLGSYLLDTLKDFAPWEESWPVWSNLTCLVLLLFTDWFRVQTCQAAIEKRFGHKLPEELVRRLLEWVRWLDRYS